MLPTEDREAFVRAASRLGSAFLAVTGAFSSLTSSQAPSRLLVNPGGAAGWEAAVTPLGVTSGPQRAAPGITRYEDPGARPPAWWRAGQARLAPERLGRQTGS